MSAPAEQVQLQTQRETLLAALRVAGGEGSSEEVRGLAKLTRLPET